MFPAATPRTAPERRPRNHLLQLDIKRRYRFEEPRRLVRMQMSKPPAERERPVSRLGRGLFPGLLVLLLCAAGGARAQDGVASDRAALQALYDATNGAAWTNDTSWSSREPLASWHGVTTDGDGRVTRLELGDNGLSGTLPAALGDLARLEALLLDGNVYLAGPVPAGLRELPALAAVGIADGHRHGRLSTRRPPGTRPAGRPRSGPGSTSWPRRPTRPTGMAG